MVNMIKLIHPATGTVREVPISRQNKIRILRRAGMVDFDTYRPKKKPVVVPDQTVSDIVAEHKLKEVESTDTPEAVTAIHVSAAARTLVEENALDPALIEGTGKDGSITKPDVEKYLKALEKSNLDHERRIQEEEAVEKAMRDGVEIATHDDPEPPLKEEEEETE